MKRAALALGFAPALLAVYQYYYSDILTTIDLAKWNQNGTVTATSYGLTAPSGNGGSLISSVAVPDGSSSYEVNTTLTLALSGGTYVQYLRASSDAKSGPAAAGTYYAIELQNPTFSGGGCAAGLAAYKRVSGVVTLLTYTTVPCRNGMTIRTVYNSIGQILVWVDRGYYLYTMDSAIAAGKPGVGAYATPAGNSISRVDLGPLDRLAPNPVNVQTLGTSAFPNFVDMQWQPPEDPNGVGAWAYDIYRNGAYVGMNLTTEFTDAAVAPSTTYTYTIQAIDYHVNYASQTSFTITTPPAGAIDPRRIGVRPLGSYWGAADENIDTRSGNLNFTLPLLRAQGRGGWGVPFALSYNSQLWRQDGGGTWKLGRDVGYGFGWRLLAGSITPYWNNGWSIHHYVYTDASGAEYRLDANTNGIWTSREGVYVEYDAAAQRLYFPDGSYWVMGAVSAGTEEDAGTRYPTLMLDTNGNQVLLRYLPGVGVTWADSSARISEIEDVRAVQGPNSWRTYSFTYSADAIPHLTRIDNYIGTGEGYDFSYLGGQQLYSPFSPPVAFGTTTLLAQASQRGVGLSHGFEHGGGAGELTRVTLPYGGYLRWDYRPFTYLSGDPGWRRVREVQYRYLSKAAGAAEATYTLTRDDANDIYRSVHYWSVVSDPSGPAKVWVFWQSPVEILGQLAYLEERTSIYGTMLRRQDFGLAYDSAQRLYFNAVQTCHENWQCTRSEQDLDSHGNITASRIWNYGTLARTYTHTYLANSNYTARHIWNRLVSTTVTGGGQNATLVTNTYDGATLTDRTGLREHDAAYGTGFAYRGNVTRRVTPGAVRNITYDIGGAVVNVDDGYGHTLGVQAAAGTNYAAPGLLTPYGDAQLATSLTYSSFLGLTSTTNAATGTAQATYDGYGRPATSTSPHGAVTNYYYYLGPNFPMTVTGGRVEKTTLDGLGRPVKVEVGPSVVSIESVVETEYDACACSPVGKVKRVSQPYAPGGTKYWTTYTYDALGRTTRIELPSDPDGPSKTIPAGGGQGRYVRVQLSGSNYLSLAEVQVLGTGGQNLAQGRAAAQSSTGFSGVASRAVDGNTDGNYGNGSVTHTELNANAWWDVDLGASASISEIRVWNRTDCCSERLGDYWVFVSDTPFGAQDTPATLQNRAGTWNSHQVTTGSGAITYAYAGNTTTVTDPAGRWKQYTVDGMGNLVQVTEPAPEGGTHQTYYTYNVLNQLSGVSMPRGSPVVTQTRTFVYDLATGRLTSATNPESGTTTYTYNADGTLASKTDAKGQRTEYVYDPQKQWLTRVRHLIGGVEDAGQQINYTYEPSGRLATVHSSSPVGTFTETFGYTPGGLVSMKRLESTWLLGQLTASFGYTGEGRLASVMYPASKKYEDGWVDVPGPYYTMQFDALGRPVKMVSQSTGPEQAFDLVKDVVYGPAGEIREMKYAAWDTELGIYDRQYRSYYRETRTYNSRLQMTWLTLSGIADGYQAPAPPPVNLEYRYPAAGNDGRITHAKDWIAGVEVGYTYDTLGRLTSAVTTGPQWGMNLRYDGFGNLTAQEPVKGSAPSLYLNYDQTTNRILGLTYDANGNLSSYGSYDVENRLVAAGGEQHVYGAGNRRLWSSGGEGKVYFYGPDGRLLATYVVQDARYTQAKNYVYFAGKTVWTTPRDAQRYAGEGVAEDRLGSWVRPWGVSISYPYGENANRFGTYLRSSTNGLDYAMNRWYSSGIARFLTPDLSDTSVDRSNPASWNRYTYTLGDPTNLHDPSGANAQSPYPPGYCPAEYSYDECVRLGFIGGGGGEVGGGGGRGGFCPGGPRLLGGVPNPLCFPIIVLWPPPTDDPPEIELDCVFDGANIPSPSWGEGSNGYGYQMPIYLNFTATGGTDTYTWGNSQVVKLTGTITWDDKTGVDTSRFPPTKEKLANTATNPLGASASFFDAPGLALNKRDRSGRPIAKVLSANLTWSFNFQATVSSGTQTADCPSVAWSATLNWKTLKRKPIVTGRVRVLP